MNKRSKNFKEYLQEELILRCKKNPAYSLRSFAKSLDISPSFLSKLLNGSRKVTGKTFKQCALKLNLDNETIKSFELYSSESNFDDEYSSLQTDYFKLISDWHHYAILELIKVKDFKNSNKWISSQLGINETQVKSAIGRLKKLGLLEEKSKKLIPVNKGNTTLKHEFTNIAFKNMQDQLLKKAISSLWDEDINKRDQTSICMAINPVDIPEVKTRLKKFRRNLCNFLERKQNQKPKQVYNLSLSFFPLSKEQ